MTSNCIEFPGNGFILRKYWTYKYFETIVQNTEGKARAKKKRLEKAKTFSNMSRIIGSAGRECFFRNVGLDFFAKKCARFNISPNTQEGKKRNVSLGRNAVRI